jgi:rRNA pseudouridine-1189 N-methylase Emg1 (Nep1/Mra1 family)
MDKNFDDFIDKKAKQLPNRRYEVRYPENVKIIVNLLEQCVEKKKTTPNHYLYSYRSIAEYLYDECQMLEVTKEGLRKAISRIAKDYNLEL